MAWWQVDFSGLQVLVPTFPNRFESTAKILNMRQSDLFRDFKKVRTWRMNLNFGKEIRDIAIHRNLLVHTRDSRLVGRGAGTNTPLFEFGGWKLLIFFVQLQNRRHIMRGFPK